MTTSQVVETSVTVNINSPIQDYVHPDDQTQPTFEMTPGFKPFTKSLRLASKNPLSIPRSNLSTYGDGAFLTAAPQLWNYPPSPIQNSSSVASFKSYV